MPAAKEDRIIPEPGKKQQQKQVKNISRLGVIAGGGALPKKLLEFCQNQGIEVFIVAFEGQTEPSLIAYQPHMWTHLGAAGQILKALKAHEIRDLVLIGSLRRPAFSELKPDLKALKFITQIGFQALGDDSLLKALKKMLEAEGFTLHGVHHFIEDLLIQPGVLGRIKPKKEDWGNIKHGWEISQAIGSLDIGQSVIIQQGIVLGVEAVEGTDSLIHRCKDLKRKGRAGVLVKSCKPQQDEDFDLPTIGPETLRNAAQAGLAGIAVQAGRTLIVDAQEVTELADQYKIFIIGIDPESGFNA